MTISALGSSSSLATVLKMQGVSSNSASRVAEDLDASISATTKNGTTADAKTVRAALSDRMAADVASGKISQKEADAVNKTLDARNPETATSAADSSSTAAAASGTSGTTAASGTAKASGGGHAGGGGGGGGSQDKTEVSRVTTVSGAIETITITYSDGSTETETEAATGSDASKSAANSSAASPPDGSGYTSKIDPGSLVNEVA